MLVAASPPFLGRVLSPPHPRPLCSRCRAAERVNRPRAAAACPARSPTRKSRRSALNPGPSAFSRPPLSSPMQQQQEPAAVDEEQQVAGSRAKEQAAPADTAAAATIHDLPDVLLSAVLARLGSRYR